MSNSRISQSLPFLMDRRATGLLLHPSSLPGSQGIGSLGAEARSFVDFLELAGFSYWQTCPSARLALGILHIKYFVQMQCNPYFIDWNPVQEVGLLRRETDLLPLKELPAEFTDYGELL